MRPPEKTAANPYEPTIEEMAGGAEKKAAQALRQPLRYLVLSMLAGCYVGIGIVLIFAVGTPLAAAHSPFVKLVMGASFGIALTLVIFAGSELFTGTNMVMAIGALTGRAGLRDVLSVWAICYLGNLAGSLGLALLVARAGVFAADPSLVNQVVSTKMALAFTPALLRGALCNWLVCLALWTAARTSSDGAKLGLVFWCLFAFIASGYEHSVANMTLLAIPLFQAHPDSITWAGLLHNLVPVTIGNVLGGGVLVGGAYWLAAGRPAREAYEAGRVVRIPDAGVR